MKRSYLPAFLIFISLTNNDSLIRFKEAFEFNFELLEFSFIFKNNFLLSIIELY